MGSEKRASGVARALPHALAHARLARTKAHVPDDPGDLTPQMRAARAASHLAQGEALLTQEVAVLCGMSHDGAYKMLCSISYAVPIYQGDDSRWRYCVCIEVAG
jgi:hypothetical protein